MARVERGAPITAERGGGRGQRDPALRQRIEQDRPVYDEGTPDGEVRVRGPRAGNQANKVPVNLDEITDEQYMDLVDQGLIEDGDTGEIELDIGELNDTGEEELDELLLLSPGDVVYAKVHHPIRYDDDPSNFTYGIASRIQNGETEEEAFFRISSICNTRALDLARSAMEPVMKFKDDVHRARREAVGNRGGLRQREKESD